MYPHQMRVCGLTGEATPKQIEYAKEINRVFGEALPERNTKQAYSDYINKYAKKYKAVMQGRSSF